MNLVETVAQEMKTDNVSTKHRSLMLDLIWKQASSKERQVISLVFTVLCGWSMRYLRYLCKNR